MVDIKANVSEGSLNRKKVTTIDYDVQHPTFSADLERQPIYSFVVGRGIHTDRFGIHRDGTGKEIIADELDVSFQEPTYWERFKLGLALIFPFLGNKYGATLTKHGIQDGEIQALQPQADEYNRQCGVGIQAEYTHLREQTVEDIPTGDCIVDKL